jgi:hypothetical protein
MNNLSPFAAVAGLYWIATLFLLHRNETVAKSFVKRIRLVIPIGACEGSYAVKQASFLDSTVVAIAAVPFHEFEQAH